MGFSLFYELMCIERFKKYVLLNMLYNEYLLLITFRIWLIKLHGNIVQNKALWNMEKLRRFIN